MLDLEMLKDELVGIDCTVIDLSNRLQARGCEDICEFGNWEELLEDGNVIVATDECGENHIQVYFNLIAINGKDEVVETSYIEIVDITEF